MSLLCPQPITLRCANSGMEPREACCACCWWSGAWSARSLSLAIPRYGANCLPLRICLFVASKEDGPRLRRWDLVASDESIQAIPVYGNHLTMVSSPPTPTHIQSLAKEIGELLELHYECEQHASCP